MELINPQMSYKTFLLPIQSSMFDGEQEVIGIMKTLPNQEEDSTYQGRLVATACSTEMANAILDMLDPSMTLDQLGYISDAAGLMYRYQVPPELLQIDAQCGPVEKVEGGAWVPMRVFISDSTPECSEVAAHDHALG